MKKFLLLAFSVFILGVGCAEQAPAPQVTDPEPIAVQRQPRQPDPLDAVYAFCEANGNQIVLQFDDQVKQSRVLCVFANNTQCDAAEYMNGACGPEKGAKIFANTGNDISALIRTCTSADPVICGGDGRNYTNRCVAELQRVTVLHEGVCTAEEQAETLTPSDPVMPPATPQTPGAAQVAPNQTNPGTAPAQKEPQQWLSLLYQMIMSRGKSMPPARVEACTINGQTVYHYVDAFSVLYSDQGRVLCFPKNDVTNTCPEPIKEKNRSAYCKEIWRDNR